MEQKRLRVRLVAVQVHVALMVDDGEILSPLESAGLKSPDPISVTAAEWPTFATGQFLDDIEAMEGAINNPLSDEPQPQE